MTNAFYVKYSNNIVPIYGVNSLEEAKQYVLPEDHNRIVETDENVYMNTKTGSVDFLSGWSDEDIDNGEVIEVMYDLEEDGWVQKRTLTWTFLKI